VGSLLSRERIKVRSTFSCVRREKKECFSICQRWYCLPEEHLPDAPAQATAATKREGVIKEKMLEVWQRGSLASRPF